MVDSPPASPQSISYPKPISHPTMPSVPSSPPQTPSPQPEADPALREVNVQEPGFTQEETKSFSLKSLLKLLYVIGFIGFVLVGVFLISKRIFTQDTGEVKGDILLQTHYQPVLWKDFGEVFEPVVKIPLYYPSEGFVEHEFLLDSGALVSSLPREEAKKMGLSLAKLPRSTFGGFGGTTSFAYKGEVKIKVGDQEVVIPVVFTEAGGTKSILGRSGFFEKYSIYFNAKQERIEIRK